MSILSSIKGSPFYPSDLVLTKLPEKSNTATNAFSIYKNEEYTYSPTITVSVYTRGQILDVVVSVIFFCHAIIDDVMITFET